MERSVWSFRASGVPVDLWHARYKQSLRSSKWICAVIRRRVENWPRPAGPRPLAGSPCETVIGCTPCSCANPGAVGKHFLSWRIDFLRQRPANRARNGRRNRFRPGQSSIDPPGRLINLSERDSRSCDG